MYKFKLFCIFKENSATFTLKKLFHLSSNYQHPPPLIGKKKSKVSFLKVSLPILEKEMAANSSILAWRIPGTEEPAIYGVARSWTRLKQLKSNSFQLSKNHVGW